MIGARPSQGKTALELSVAYNVAYHAGEGVGIFSMEMGRDQLVQRMLSMHTGLDLQRIRVGDRARRMCAQRQISLLCVDYLQLMTGSGRGENRVQEVTEISRGLKQLARELDVPVLALSQLSRNVDQRPSHIPVLSDFRESGAIEQDCDIAAGLYREESYDKDTERKGIAELHILKQRNGPLGVVPLRFEGRTTQFQNLEHYRAPVGY